MDLTNPTATGDFERCGQNRPAAADLASYLENFPRCVTADWLEQVRQLPPPEAALRIEYAVLAKQVAVMENCQLPGTPGVKIPVDPVTSYALADQVAILRARRNELLAGIRQGEQCADVHFEPATVSGPSRFLAPNNPGEAALMLRGLDESEAMKAATAALLLGHRAWAEWASREGVLHRDREAVAGILSLWSMLDRPTPGFLHPPMRDVLHEWREALVNGTMLEAEAAVLPSPDSARVERAVAVLYYLQALTHAVAWLEQLDRGEGAGTSRNELLGRIARTGLQACIHTLETDANPDVCLDQWVRILG